MSAVKINQAILPQPPQGQSSAGVGRDVNDLAAKKRAEAEKVAQDFETMFVELMVKSMRQTAQREDMSNAEDIYQGMLDSEYSKGMAASRSFGIKEQVLNWLEQTDPNLKQNSSASSGPSDAVSHSTDTQKLRNEALALKAATQAYQITSGSR
jgi:peptidoglycan hydrolase FlgJ